MACPRRGDPLPAGHVGHAPRTSCGSGGSDAAAGGSGMARSRSSSAAPVDLLPGDDRHPGLQGVAHAQLDRVQRAGQPVHLRLVGESHLHHAQGGSSVYSMYASMAALGTRVPAREARRVGDDGRRAGGVGPAVDEPGPHVGEAPVPFSPVLVAHAGRWRWTWAELGQRLQRADLGLAAQAARHAVDRPQLEGAPRGHGLRPPRRRARYRAWRSSPASSPPSCDAAPSAPSPTHPGAHQVGHRRDAGAQPGVGARAVRHAGAGGREAVDLVAGEVDADGQPDVGADPAEAVEVLDRPHAVALQAERLLLARLGQMGVPPHRGGGRGRPTRP